ncbi:alcohol dehydrogenase [Fusarium albosuccineum]|uniref:Alcohol dehydrogenase n=1 Tax=Fusarium albosuccineum TaxID=1237068 RepID=A0A8H4LLG3_9HYPO|nr:alcohol dehydrogenase [Fusarium albosuccineum]
MSQAKVALVTAASSGLGAAIARMIAVDLGMNVVINFNSNASRAEHLAKSIQDECNATRTKSPVSIQTIQADMCDKSRVKSLVEDAAARFGGRLDVVISNVGWTRMRNFSDLEDNVDEDDWDRCFTTNVKSHLWLFHAAKKYLEESNLREAGAAVFPYAVTKSAQIHLGRCLATIAAPSIRVNTISPGILLTEWGLSFPPARLELARKSNKLDRFATVEDVVQQVKTFVLSKSVTGQNAVVDAGFTL